MPPPILLSIPNVSEGRDETVIARIGRAFAGTDHEHDAGAGLAEQERQLRDTHSDRDHHRSVFTISGESLGLIDAILSGAREVLATVELSARSGADPTSVGQHPHVGALDVVPFVYLDPALRGVACAAALAAAERLGDELALPVLLYGELTASGNTPLRTRAQLRRGGLGVLTERMRASELKPDFGPSKPHPTAGVTLLAARPPLVAFNLQLAPPADLESARAIAAQVREGGSHGLPGLRAIGIELAGSVAQVSMNIERPFETPLAAVVAAVAALAPLQSAELVGLAPTAAMAGFPEDLPMPGFDPERHLIENALGSN
jgi:glutamate formiminotransferase